MSTSKESTLPASALPTDHHTSVAQEPGGLPSRMVIDPNNPPWGLYIAVLTWFGSVLLLFSLQLPLVVPYALYQNPGASGAALQEFLSTDRTAILLQLISVIPAHLLTIGLVWVVVTGFGKRPFRETIGWSWSEHMGFWSSAGLALALVLTGLILTKIIGGDPTQLDQIVASSTAARYMIVIMATATAPLVEELVYRGVLYSALQRAIGSLWAIVGVMVLFTVIHIPQYWGNFGVIATIGILSLFLTVIRAYTGRLLPCIVIHTVFNGISSVLIILEPYIQRDPSSEQKANVVEMLSRLLHSIS